MIDNDQQLKSLKEHLDSRFDSHEKVDSLVSKRHDEIMDRLSTQLDNLTATAGRAHTRVDRLETQLSTIKAVGTAIATSLGAAAAWIGLTK